MEMDKRIGEEAVPRDMKNYLNDVQIHRLFTIENFGWGLKYIRRSSLTQPVVIVAKQDGSSFGVLEADGRLNLDTDIQLRH